MTPEELAEKLDRAFELGLGLSSDLRALDPEGKPPISVKELTDLLKVGVEWYKCRKESADTKYGVALTRGSNGSS